MLKNNLFKMDSEVIIALIFGVSSIISSICFGIVPTIRKENHQNLKQKINVYCLM